MQHANRTQTAAAGTLVLIAGLLLIPVNAAGAPAGAVDEPSAATRLGRALFADQRFTNPAADYHASCSGCHATGGSMPDRSERVFADYTARSLTATKETTLRNTPTLLGAAEAQRFGLDGRYDSLTGIIADKLTGPAMGWGPNDRTRARDAIQFTLLEEGSAEGESYVALFREAYGVELRQQAADDALAAAVRALADYVTTLGSSETARWDAFRTQNRIDRALTPEDTPKSYAGRLEGRIGNQEGRMEIKRPEGFTAEAYQGFKIFFRTFGETSVGNCVSCHPPPHFTDFALHNIGVSQAEYDAVHGSGAFAKLEITAGRRPAPRFLAVPSPEKPEDADLGYWNYAPADELAGALGAFKTPTLRNLSHTDPYMHNGAYASLEDAVEAIVRLSELARAGKLRGGDPELETMRLDADDVGPLVAFLRQLDDVGAEDFRYYLIHFEE